MALGVRTSSLVAAFLLTGGAVHATGVPVTALPTELAEFPVSADTRVELVVAACKQGGECTLSLQLRDAQRLLAEQNLIWGLSTYGWNESDTPTVHVARTGATRFTISFGNREGIVYEQDQLEVEVTPLKLRGFTLALLVTEVGGFESVGEAYAVYSVTPQKITVPFRQEFSTAMQQVSSAAVVDLDRDGSDEVVVTETWQHFFVTPDSVDPDEPPMPDTVSFHVFPKKRRGALRAYAVVLASSKSYVELVRVRAALQEHRCLAGQSLLLLSTTDDPSLYPELAKDIFFVGDILPNESDARERLRRIQACDPKLEGYVKRAL